MVDQPGFIRDTHKPSAFEGLVCQPCATFQNSAPVHDDSSRGVKRKSLRAATDRTKARGHDQMFEGVAGGDRGKCLLSPKTNNIEGRMLDPWPFI